MGFPIFLVDLFPMTRWFCLSESQEESAKKHDDSRPDWYLGRFFLAMGHHLVEVSEPKACCKCSFSALLGVEQGIPKFTG